MVISLDFFNNIHLYILRGLTLFGYIHVDIFLSLYCLSLSLCPFSFCHCIVYTCPFVLFLFVIVLSVLVRLSVFFLSLYCLYLSVCPFSFCHCIVCTCPFVLYLFVIVLSVLVRLSFFFLSLYCLYLSVCSFSFSFCHCISVLVRLSFFFLSLYCLYLSVCPFFVIVLSVLQRMVPDYSFGIFKWRSVPKYREKTIDLPLVTDKLYHIMLYWAHLAMNGFSTHSFNWWHWLHM